MLEWYVSFSVVSAVQAEILLEIPDGANLEAFKTEWLEALSNANGHCHQLNASLPVFVPSFKSACLLARVGRLRSELANIGCKARQFRVAGQAPRHHHHHRD